MTFNALFTGNEERYLTFNPSTLTSRDGDAKMKPDYRTISRAPDTPPEQWAVKVEAAIADHLSGRQSFGLSPLRDGKVRFAALDIDLYPFLESEVEIEN